MVMKFTAKCAKRDCRADMTHREQFDASRPAQVQTVLYAALSPHESRTLAAWCSLPWIEKLAATCTPG
jgi:hypothetical protein